jgi:hypothetical protein
MKCEECEYELTCFGLLKLVNGIANNCQQGRKRKVYTVKRTIKSIPKDVKPDAAG